MPTKVGSRTYQRTSLSQGRTSPQNIGGGRGASCRWPIPAGIRRSPPACGSLPLIILIVLDKMLAAVHNGKPRKMFRSRCSPVRNPHLSMLRGRPRYGATMVTV